jgi:integrase
MITAPRVTMFISKRNKIWYVFYHDATGSRRKVSTGASSKTDALNFLATFRRENEGVEVTGPKLVRNTHSHITMSQFRDEYIAYSLTTHTEKTTKHHRTALNELIRIIGDRYVQDITVKDIERFIGVKRSEASGYTARKYYSALRSSFTAAVRWDIVPINIFHNVEKPKAVEVRPAYFTRDQFRILLRVMHNREVRDVTMFAVNTGMRLGEIINLHWRDVDFIRRVINVVNNKSFTTKTKRSRTIPMNESLYRLLAERSEIAVSELVFHDRVNKWRDTKLSKKFKDYVRLAGLPDELKFHSLRHTFASWLVMSGVSLYEVSRLIGHSTVQMSEKYAHLQTDGLHDTVNKIAVNYITGE